MSNPPVLPEAQPWSHDGGRVGALCIHGFTGNPSAMRPVAEAFAAAGYSVELPRLPGHGTTVEDMITTGWSDWTAEGQETNLAIFSPLHSRQSICVRYLRWMCSANWEPQRGHIQKTGFPFKKKIVEPKG